MSDYHVVYSAPLPRGGRTDSIDIDSERIALRVADDIRGGFAGCSVGYRRFAQPNEAGELAQPISVRHLGHLQVWRPSEDGLLAYEGRISGFNRPGGHQATAVRAIGYSRFATKDVPFYAAASEDSPLTGQELIRRAITQSTILQAGDKDQIPWIGGAWQPNASSGQYPNQIIDAVLKASDDQGRLLAYLMYEDRVAQIVPREVPKDDNGQATSDYLLDFDAETMDWDESGEQLIGSAAVQYQLPGTDQQATDVKTDETFRDDYGGLMRMALITNVGTGAIGALSIRDAQLARYRQPIITCTVKRDKWRPMLNRAGGAVPLAAVRSGQWLQVAGERPLMIVAGDKDLSTDVGTFTISNI